MTPLVILKAAVLELEKLDCKYCLIGGHAASLYRNNERFTKDVDFALMSSDMDHAKSCAIECLTAIGLEPVVGFIPKRSKDSKRKLTCLITSKPEGEGFTGIIDILLPELPWVGLAVERAQYNRIDLGFADVPVITPEDLILAKCYAIHDAPDRFQDLDDLKELFISVEQLDLDYLKSQLTSLKIQIPDLIQKYAPKYLAGKQK